MSKIYDLEHSSDDPIVTREVLTYYNNALRLSIGDKLDLINEKLDQILAGGGTTSNEFLDKLEEIIG